MKVLEGKSVFSGIAIGKISILQKVDASVKRVHVEDPEEEVKRVGGSQRAGCGHSFRSFMTRLFRKLESPERQSLRFIR